MSSSDKVDGPPGAGRRSQPKPTSWSANDPLATGPDFADEPEPVERKKKRLSRRVSFADTCLVKLYCEKGDGCEAAGAEAVLCDHNTMSAGTGSEQQGLQEHQESLGNRPVLSAASIQSLLTAPLAAPGTSVSDRMSTQFYTEMNEVYEQPIKSMESTSSSEESRQTVKDYTNSTFSVDCRYLHGRDTHSQQLPLDKTVYDADTSMQLTMCAGGIVAWPDDDKVDGRDHQGLTTCYFDESMEMTMTDCKPIELRPAINAQHVMAEVQPHERHKQPINDQLHFGLARGGTWQHAEVNECDKENVLTSNMAAAAAKAASKLAAPPCALSSVRGPPAPGRDLSHSALRYTGMMAEADGNATILVATDMDLTVPCGGSSGTCSAAGPQRLDVTDLMGISMDMTVARPTRIQTHLDDKDDEAQPVASETLHFADASMSIVSLSDDLLPEVRSTGAPDATQACHLAVVAHGAPVHSPAFSATLPAASQRSINGVPETAAAVPDKLAAVTEDATVTSREIPRFMHYTDGLPGDSLPHMPRDASVTMCNDMQMTQVDIAKCREPTVELSCVDLVPSASNPDDSLRDAGSHAIAVKAEGGHRSLGSGCLSADTVKALAADDVDSTRFLPDANRGELTLGSPVLVVEPVAIPSIDDTVWLLRDSTRALSLHEDLDVANEQVLPYDSATSLEDTASLLRGDSRLSAHQARLSDVLIHPEDSESASPGHLPCCDSTNVLAPKHAVTELGPLATTPAAAGSSQHCPTYSVPDCFGDALELALSRLHMGRDVACPDDARASPEEPGPPAGRSMARLLQQLCDGLCRDPCEDMTLAPLSPECDADVLRLLHHTHLVKPLQAQLQLACNQLNHHFSSLQNETEAIENQLRRIIVDRTADDSKAGSFVQQVITADGTELQKLQGEFRQHQDRLDAVLEAKYEEWLSKCVGNVGDCWAESSGLLDAALIEVQDGIRRMSEMLDEGHQLSQALDSRVETLQRQRLAEEPAAEELATYKMQCLELERENQGIQDGTREMEALLETKRNLVKKKDDLEKMYNEYIDELRKLTTAAAGASTTEKPDAAAVYLTEAGGIAASSSSCPGPGLVTRPDSRGSTCLASYRAWTLESTTANGVSLSFFHGTVVLDVKLDSASPSEQKCIKDVVIQSLLDESSDDAARLAVNSVARYFNDNDVRNKYRGSQLVKEMLLEMSFVAQHMDELAVEIMDARLRRDCIISSLRGDNRQHLVRLEVSFHNITELTKFWLLLDFDVLLYPNNAFCITFEDDLGGHRNHRHIENVAALVRPGLHYLSRLIDAVCQADSTAPT